ncbi:MAG: hypothetical protein SF187_14230 [Deltaproteobacteria bacterium]|nr:hypothetical protein [Deltaproteobacteria bacterium]
MRAEVGALLALLVWPSLASAEPTRPEKNRQQLLDELGLHRVNKPEPAEPKPAEAEPAEPESPTTQPSAAAESTKPAGPAPPSFKRQIHPWLNQMCGACHMKDGPAGATGLLLGQSGARDHASVVKFTNMRAPKKSSLVLKALGSAHGGGAVATAGSSEMRRLLAWIASGAPYVDPVADANPVALPATRAPSKNKANTEVAPAAAAPAEPAANLSATPVVVASPEVSSLPETPKAAPASTAFADVVHPVLHSKCSTCHSAAGMAARTRFVLTGDIKADYAGVAVLVTPGAPDQSLLLQKASGQAHLPVLPKGTEAFIAVAAWINDGAPSGAPSPPASIEAAAPDTGGRLTSSTPSPPLSHASLPMAPPSNPGFALAGFRLNGRFDMNLERRGVSAQPFSDGQTQLQNYHHFLFLSRDDADEPINFSVELTALTFWEASLRVSPAHAPYDLRLKVGKLIVPFGAEPLFHQSYGGLQGFDQKVLPVFWAQNGFGAKLSKRLSHLGLMADAFVVRGYALRDAEGVLSLQSDISSTDDVRPAYGLRLNASFGPASAYYSLLVNGLGFGRTLVMQAIDLSLWRWHGVPVLERFTFGLGFLRADISGGGPGKDYYHFASYYQARFYITDVVYVQYRQGLRTFNNRRGFYQDTTRFTVEDGSAHNVGIVWRHKAWTTGAFGFWNLEKVNEARDDFFRLVVAYEF